MVWRSLFCLAVGFGLGVGAGLLFWIYYFSLLDVLTVGTVEQVVHKVRNCVSHLSPYCTRPCTDPLLRCLEDSRLET